MIGALALTMLLGQIPVDVPVPLKQAHAVFNVMNIVEPPARQNSLFLMQTLSDRLRAKKVPQKIVAVFHSQAAALACSDKTYNRLMKVSTGNPYKQVLQNIQASGIQTEICVVSMEAQKIAKKDLLPGFKVNGGGLLRVIQLTQKGYTQFSF
jgi:intracellular sulfur oxidation DsrE/DsrF family protein